MDRAAEPSFETALARLTEIVEALEKGDLPLERSLALFEEGVRLSRVGAERLEQAELRVEQLLADKDKPNKTIPVEPDVGTAADKKKELR